MADAQLNMPRRATIGALAFTLIAAPLAAQAPSVPLVDLAPRRDLHLTVDREAGQYLGHPTTVLLEDGRTMFVVYPKGHGAGPIVMRRSTDAGRTWSAPLRTPASWATSKETPTIHRTVDARGKKLLVLFSGLYPARRAISEDDGATWTELEPVGDWGGIVVMSSVIALQGAPGRYMAFFHDDGRYFAALRGASRFTVYVTETADGGRSWDAPRAIVSDSAARLCEPGVVRSPDGRTIAVMLRENSRRFTSMLVTSTDEGRTWSAPRALPRALLGDRHVAAYAADGRLVVTFRDVNKDSPTWGDWLAWVGTFDDLIAGREGQYRIRLDHNTKDADCCYAGLERLSDDTFVTTTYGHWTEGAQPYIGSVRFTLRLADSLAIVEQARAAIAPLTDSVALHAAGFTPLGFGRVRDLTPFQGQHWLHLIRIVMNAPVAPSQPAFVMYVPIRDTLRAVGVAYAQRQRLDAPIPTTLAGASAEWHAHVFCRNIPGEGAALADGADDCAARGGTVSGLGRGGRGGGAAGMLGGPQEIVMVHAWTVPNPDGPFAHDNPALPYLAPGRSIPVTMDRDNRLFGVALGETYGAKLPMAIRIDAEAARDGADSALVRHRAAMRGVVRELQDAEQRRDGARFGKARAALLAEWTALYDAYQALAKSPQIRERLVTELSQLLGDSAHHHH